jgi:hypothetical protein
MTTQEKREDRKKMIITQLRRKVRPHRPAVKVLEIAIAITEERIESMEDQLSETKWGLEYTKNLTPAEIEPYEKKS